ERWYSQAGTPRVQVQAEYDEANQAYALTLTQSCPPTPGQPEKQAFHIPVAVGLLDSQGRDMPLRLEGESSTGDTTRVLELTENQQTFRFVNVKEKPVPSLLRNFSAPVVLNYSYSDEELVFLMAHDSDPFNRWEAGQRFAMMRMLDLVNQVQEGAVLDDLSFPEAALCEAFRKTLTDRSLDASFRELALTLPSETMLSEQVAVIDPQTIHAVRQFLRRRLAGALRDEWFAAYEESQTPGDYSPDALSAGRRALKNLALAYLIEVDDEEAHYCAQSQYDLASNMTDRVAALAALINSSAPGREAALEHFYDEFRDEALVVDKWFSLQAMSRTTDVGVVRKLLQHPAFTLKIGRAHV